EPGFFASLENDTKAEQKKKITRKRADTPGRGDGSAVLSRWQHPRATTERGVNGRCRAQPCPAVGFTFNSAFLSTLPRPCRTSAALSRIFPFLIRLLMFFPETAQPSVSERRRDHDHQRANRVCDADSRRRARFRTRGIHWPHHRLGAGEAQLRAGHPRSPLRRRSHGALEGRAPVRGHQTTAVAEERRELVPAHRRRPTQRDAHHLHGNRAVHPSGPDEHLDLRPTRNGENFIFDIGEGSVANYIAAGFALNELDKVFITHLHIDHFGALPFLYEFGGWAGR